MPVTPDPRPHRQLTVDEVIATALVQARTHGAGEDDEDASYLVELHERCDQETYERAVVLIGSSGVEEAILGLRILRELGPWGARTFRADAVPLLRDVIVQRGTDRDILRWALYALAWQGDRTVADDILKFVNHPDDKVRAVAIHNLDQFIDRHELRPDVLAALVVASRDHDRGNRYSATYDMAHWVDVTREEVTEALVERLDDEDDVVRVFAAAGLARSESGWKRLRAHHDLPELRIGDADPEYIAIRPLETAGPWGETAVLIRGRDIAWSAISQVGIKDWKRWSSSLRRYRAEHRPFTMRLSATLDVALTLGWHPGGVPLITGRVRTQSKRWHEGLTFCWRLSEPAIDRLADGLTQTIAWLTAETGATK